MAVLADAALADKQSEMTQTERYRLVLFNHAGTHVLLRQERNRNSLPELRIPKFKRPAEQIITLLRDRWGLPALLLWSQLIDQEPDNYYAVFEVSKGDRQVPPGLDWFPVQNAASYLNEADALFVKASHAKTLQVPFGADSAPFSRLGWIYNLQTWIENIVGPKGVTLGHFSQLSGSEDTSLVKFDTSQLPLWFKAVGQADPQEFVNTQILSALFAEHLPPILAFDPIRNAWLMESGGETLRHYPDLNTWLMVVQRLAALQIESGTRTSDLLRAGCRDVRSTTLLGLVVPFFKVMQELMTQQKKICPPPLLKQDLFELAASVRDALNELSNLGLPDALGHSDFNPGNILIAEDRCVFIDWYSAHVGNPLLTLEYLLAHRRKSCPGSLAEEQRLREAYAQWWLATVSPANIARALQLAPLVAVYAYAIAGNSWQDANRLARPGIPGYLRSLTRIMKREASSLKPKEGPCLTC